MISKMICDIFLRRRLPGLEDLGIGRQEYLARGVDIGRI